MPQFHNEGQVMVIPNFKHCLFATRISVGIFASLTLIQVAALASLAAFFMDLSWLSYSSNSSGKGKWVRPLQSCQDIRTYILPLTITVSLLFQRALKRSSKERLITKNPRESPLSSSAVLLLFLLPS